MESNNVRNWLRKQRDAGKSEEQLNKESVDGFKVRMTEDGASWLKEHLEGVEAE